MQQFLSPARIFLAAAGMAVAVVGVGTGVHQLRVHAAAAEVVMLPPPVPVIFKPEVPTVPQPIGTPEVGKASWYGEEFQGRTTASGEQFDMNEMTCAHRTLPLGSMLKVTNLHNHRTIMVRVNDRGPVPEDRILDLSMAAATKLGIRGLGKVSIQRVRIKKTSTGMELAVNRPVPPPPAVSKSR